MITTKKIYVMVVDDHEIVRFGLNMLLESCPEFEMVGTVANGEKAIELCPIVKPDVIVMDMMMPGMNGVEATRQICKIYSETKVIILTSFDDQSLVHSALKAGAISYLLKNASMSEISEAIHKAYHGKTTLAPEATQALVAVIREPEAL